MQEDEELQLSSHALNALREFRQEEQLRQEQFEKLLQLSSQNETEHEVHDEEEAPVDASIDIFQEDWNLSQFWYSDETANLLADELLQGADETTHIVIVSAPSVYAALKKRSGPLATEHIYLLEFDDRFKILAGSKHFVHYDFARPLELPKELSGLFDRVLIDPPFLSDDCQTKASITARWLLKKNRESVSKSGIKQYRTIVCTGERMAPLISKVYPDTKETTFHPEHGNHLSNEFRCYASYEGQNWAFI